MGYLPQMEHESFYAAAAQVGVVLFVVLSFQYRYYLLTKRGIGLSGLIVALSAVLLGVVLPILVLSDLFFSDAYFVRAAVLCGILAELLHTFWLGMLDKGMLDDFLNHQAGGASSHGDDAEA
jgi:hypothetical protein